MTHGGTAGFLVGSLLLVGSSLSAQVPQWAVKRAYPNYPPDKYLLGVGHGSDSKQDETAKRMAQLDIAAQLRARVQTEVNNIRQLYKLDPRGETYVELKIRSTSIVDEDFAGGEVIATAVDTPAMMTYALAALDKEKFSASIGEKLFLGWQQAAELSRLAQELLQRGKLNEALQNLTNARGTIRTLLSEQALYNAVAAAPFSGDSSVRPSALTSSIKAALSRVRIEKKSGDDQYGKIGESFPAPFVVRVVIADGKKNIPASGVGVAFLGSSGVPLGEAVTDRAGVASFALHARRSIGSHMTARLSSQVLGNDFVPEIKASSATFDCTILDADVAFALKIESQTPAVNEALRSAVADAITHAGYHIVDMSRFVLKVGYQSVPARPSEENGGAAFSVLADITITLIDNKSQQALGSMLIKSKGAADTNGSAQERSIRRLTIDEDSLLSFLEKAKN
ncbi:MAG TPA: hypothetical protein VMM58_08010 [Bacteroidota bacterium]|nr:hypothetical protein [Bacteroidota bacterium]